MEVTSGLGSGSGSGCVSFPCWLLSFCFVVGLDSEKRSCGGAKIEYVPVPVRSGRCSPSLRIVRMRFRYWCSSWEGLDGVVMLTGGTSGFEFKFSDEAILGVD